MIVGCGGETPLKLYPVEGHVTLNGKAVPDALVQFNPPQGADATGYTDSEGNFKLKTSRQNGAIAAPHHVKVTTGLPRPAELTTSDSGALPSEQKISGGPPVDYVFETPVNVSGPDQVELNLEKAKKQKG